MQVIPLNQSKASDDELVALAKTGDRRAFSVLFERHHGQVFGMCVRMLRSRSDAEDAVQQTFLEAWRCLPRFEGKSKFTTWLCRIAIHTSFSLKRRVKRLVFGDDLIFDEPEATERSAADVASNNHLERVLHDALMHLSERKRLVVVLSDLEGKTSPEIAEIVGVPEATVRTRLFYGRKELAVLLQSNPQFAGYAPEPAALRGAS
jgi:RNA polymerase sigma-70 factor, ECF subfamily